MRRVRLVWVIVGAFLFYVAGDIARWQYGPLIIIRNASGETVHNPTVLVERQRYGLGGLAPGKQHRVFVEIKGESSVSLEFTDAQKQKHVAIIIGYIETGYCGKGYATISPSGEVTARDATTLIPCWKSWLDFF